MISAMRLLAATEGIFGETAAGVTLGVLRRLLADGLLDPGAETVIINSGDGLKTLDAMADGAPAAGGLPGGADPPDAGRVPGVRGLAGRRGFRVTRAACRVSAAHHACRHVAYSHDHGLTAAVAHCAQHGKVVPR